MQASEISQPLLPKWRVKYFISEEKDHADLFSSEPLSLEDWWLHSLCTSCFMGVQSGCVGIQEENVSPASLLPLMSQWPSLKMNMGWSGWHSIWHTLCAWPPQFIIFFLWFCEAFSLLFYFVHACIAHSLCDLATFSCSSTGSQTLVVWL